MVIRRVKNVLPTENVELLIDVNEVTPHFPTVPADFAAVGPVVLSQNNLSN